MLKNEDSAVSNTKKSNIGDRMERYKDKLGNLYENKILRFDHEPHHDDVDYILLQAFIGEERFLHLFKVLRSSYKMMGYIDIIESLIIEYSGYPNINHRYMEYMLNICI